MPRCCRCKKNKPKAFFAKRKKRASGLQDYCLPCGREYHKEWYHRNRADVVKRNKKNRDKANEEIRRGLIQYLYSHPCVDCGEDDVVVLEFDHIRGKKKFSIGGAVSGRHSWAAVVKEIQKCVVRCANCHRKRTARKAKWYRTLKKYFGSMV